MKIHGRRRAGLAGAIVLVILTASMAAGAETPSTVAEYTGCLKTNGTGNGNVYALREGSTPLTPCKAPDKEIHLSGALADGFKLPQGCANGQVAKTSAGLWVCATDIDTNTTYSPGTGLDLAGTVFGIALPFRLPQGCPDGQVAKASAGAWVCATDIDTDTDTTYSPGAGLALTGTEFGLVRSFQLPQGCADGQVAKQSGGLWFCADDIDTDTDTNNTYSAGVGLDLFHNSEFNLEPNQRLPENGCGVLEVPKWGILGGWFCGTDNVGTVLPDDCEDFMVPVWRSGQWHCSQIYHDGSGATLPIDQLHLLAAGEHAIFDDFCTDSGETVSGGGYEVDDPDADVRIIASRPAGPTAWRIEAVNDSAFPVFISVIAVCHGFFDPTS